LPGADVAQHPFEQLELGGSAQQHRRTARGHGPRKPTGRVQPSRAVIAGARHSYNGRQRRPDGRGALTHSRSLRRFVIPPNLPQPIDPAQVKHAEQRAADVQNRIADAITRFAGSMTFVYLHVIWFGAWIGFGVESYPFGLLTMIVSLE